MKLSMKIYAYHLKLSPSASYETNACIVVLNSKRIRISDYDMGKYTRFTMSISVPKDMVATEVQDPSDDARLFHDLLLSCNLVMESASLSVLKARYGYPRRKISAPKGTKHARVLKHIRVKFCDVIDERRVMAILPKVFFLTNDDAAREDVGTTNLKKALEDYRLAMSQFDRAGTFRYLFSALEASSVVREGFARNEKLLKMMASISDTNMGAVAKWNEFNNRIKHANEDKSHQEKYKGLFKDLESHVPAIRRAVQTSLTGRLEPIKCGGA